MTGTIRTIATMLNRHYPARLHRLFLVEPPPMIALPVRAILPMLHRDTAHKVELCRADSPQLPVKLR